MGPAAASSGDPKDLGHLPWYLVLQEFGTLLTNSLYTKVAGTSPLWPQPCRVLRWTHPHKRVVGRHGSAKVNLTCSQLPLDSSLAYERSLQASRPWVGKSRDWTCLVNTCTLNFISSTPCSPGNVSSTESSRAWLAHTSASANHWIPRRALPGHLTLPYGHSTSKSCQALQG